MGGNRAYFTILLITLALMCAGIVGARWAVLARRVPLAPLPAGLKLDSASNAAVAPAGFEPRHSATAPQDETPADVSHATAQSDSDASSAKPRRAADTGA